MCVEDDDYKKVVNFLMKKVHPSQNTGYAYGMKKEIKGGGLKYKTCQLSSGGHNYLLR